MVYTHCTLIDTDPDDKPWCSTLVDESGEDIGEQGKWGNCGPDCPTEDDDGWVTDDTLTVTRNFDTDADITYYILSNLS